jgi:hypothetical protein
VLRGIFIHRPFIGDSIVALSFQRISSFIYHNHCINMTITDYLQSQYKDAFDMIKFGETKNSILIAFNGAIIVGVSKLIADASNVYLYYFLLYIAGMCGISIFISFCALIAKITHSNQSLSLHKSSNLLYFGTLAHMTHDELLEKVRTQYGCMSVNSNHETDLAKQVIITSQIAVRKFKLFNTAIAFTFSGLLTPVSLIIYKNFLDVNRP